MNRSENLRRILRVLLDERAEYAGWQIPDSLPEQQTMMRALLNVRLPYPVDEEFLKAQDAELRQQSADKGMVVLSDILLCVRDKTFRLWQGDITRLQVDAIVNAANSALLGCFVPMHRCIDNAIHSAAGTGTGRLLPVLSGTGRCVRFAEYRFLLYLYGRVRISPKAGCRNCSRYCAGIFPYDRYDRYKSCGIQCIQR